MIDSARKTDPRPQQIAVYRNYLRLQALASDRFHRSPTDGLAGRLGLCVGFGQKGAELALATTIAGGTFLGIDPSAEHLKAAVRNSSCDFMVNTLDESLRTLKNELRKQTALSVGLLGLPSEILPEMVERGVQPDWLADTSSNEVAMSDTNPAAHKQDAGPPGYRQALSHLVERGARMLAPDPMLAHTPIFAFDSDTPGSSASVEVVWTAANPQDLRRMDKIALDRIPQADRVRRRWLEQAARSFYRQMPLERVIGLDPEELTHLVEAFKSAGISCTFRSSYPHSAQNKA